MSKHHKIYFGTKPKMTGPVLEGKRAESPEELQERFKRGPFRYQFREKGKRRSRIMTCSRDGELTWLMEKVKKGVRVFIEFPGP